MRKDTETSAGRGDVVRNVDVVVDTVGGDTLARSERVLRDYGRLVTLVGSVPSQICGRGRIVCPATPVAVGQPKG